MGVEWANQQLRAKRRSEKQRVRKIRADAENGYGNVRDADTPGNVHDGEMEPQADTRMASRDEPSDKN